MLRPETIIRAAPEDQVISCSLGGEAALLSLRHGSYYGLDVVGAFVWERAKPGASIAQVQEAVLERFEVEPERCQADLLALLTEMAHAGLITIQEL